MTPSVTVTEQAARKIGEILGREAPGAKLRLSVEGGGCSGFQYKFDIEHQQAGDDLVVTQDAATRFRSATSVARKSTSWTT